MKNLYKRINEFWLKCRKWSDNSIFGYLVSVIVKIVFILGIGLLLYSFLIGEPFEENQSPQDSSINDAPDATVNNCTVAGINLHGTLLTYIPNHSESDTTFNYNSVSSEDIMGYIKKANEDSNIKAIVIEADSSGGSPVAGEEIATAVKNSEKPVVAFIRDLGASSSYWAISTASKIWASRNSSVGSIGITSSYLSNAERNKKDGVVYEQLSSGIYKDTGSPDKALTSEEKSLILRDVNIIFNNFVVEVSKNRNIPIDKVRSIADGSTVLGDKAKELGLIDNIGGIFEVEKYLEQKTGEKVNICWQ